MIFFSSYNALERRDSCKGGKEANKRGPSQSSVRSSSAVLKTQASHITKKNDGHAGNASHKATKPDTSVSHAYDEKVSLLDDETLFSRIICRRTKLKPPRQNADHRAEAFCG